jgi:hypothetical protein
MPKRPEGVTGCRVYRAQRLARVLGWLVILVFFMVGVVTATGSPGDPGKGGTIGVVLGVAIGISVILLSLWAGAVAVTSSLIVTSTGLIHRNNLRKRLISWPEIDSFTVEAGQRRMSMHWPTLVVRLKDGTKVFTNVTSFTAAHPTRVARELAVLQTGAAVSPPCDPPPLPPLPPSV